MFITGRSDFRSAGTVFFRSSDVGAGAVGFARHSYHDQRTVVSQQPGCVGISTGSVGYFSPEKEPVQSAECRADPVGGNHGSDYGGDSFCQRHSSAGTDPCLRL